MPRQVRKRFWIESALAATTGILAIVTLISREWIEVLFGVDPDGGSGSLEWMIVVGLACVTVAAGVVARMEFRRAAVGLR
jgi:hypothetical protein